MPEDHGVRQSLVLSRPLVLWGEAKYIGTLVQLNRSYFLWNYGCLQIVVILIWKQQQYANQTK